MNVIALDPGQATGVAQFTSYGGPPPAFVAWQNPDWFTVASWLETVLKVQRVDLVACESFIISPQTVRKSQQTVSLELIGIVRYLCREANVELLLQRPAEAKRLATDARLRALGWWTPGQDHARDATRHLVLALLTRGVLAPSQLI